MPRVAAALTIHGAHREPALVVAASQLRHLMVEIENLATLGAERWERVAPELGCVVAAHRAVAAALHGPPFDDVRRDMMQARLAMLKVLPGDLATRTSQAKAAPIATVSASDRVQLARQLLATCRERLVAAAKRKGTIDEVGAHALCRQLALDVASATDATLHISDRAERASLLPDVNAMEERLDWLQAYLSQSPKLKWDRTFASLFDGANNLRKVMGMMPKTRAYSGVIDPAVALERARSIAQGDGAGAQVPEPANPQGAVNSIMIGVRHVHAQQQQAIVDLRKALRVHDTVPPSSTLVRIAKWAVELAIAAVSTKLGELASAGLDRILTGRTKKRLATNEYLEHLLAEDHFMHNVLVADALKQTAAARAAWTLRAKKGVEKLFDSGGKAVMTVAKSSPKMQPQGLLDEYCSLTTNALELSARAAELEIVNLQGALEQADLEALIALGQLICGEIHGAARLLQYDKSMKGWLDVEAHGATNVQADAELDLTRRPDVPGTVEVALLVGPEAHDRPRLHRMVLHGHETNARLHLQSSAEPLSSSRLNVRYVTHYYWGFGGVKDVIRSQQTSGKMLPHSMDRLERAVLRHRAAGLRMTSGSIHVAENEFLSEVGDGAAEAAHLRDIDSLALTTRLIEKA